jgi:hypothetical protein
MMVIGTAPHTARYSTARFLSGDFASMAVTDRVRTSCRGCRASARTRRSSSRIPKRRRARRPWRVRPMPCYVEWGVFKSLGPRSARTGGPGSSAKSSLFFRRKTPLLRLELFSFWTPKRTFGHDRASAKMAIQLVNAPNLVCPILSRYSFVRRAAEGAPILGPIGIGTLTQGRGAPSADPTRHCVAGPGTNLPARACCSVLRSCLQL